MEQSWNKVLVEGCMVGSNYFIILPSIQGLWVILDHRPLAVAALLTPFGLLTPRGRVAVYGLPCSCARRYAPASLRLLRSGVGGRHPCFAGTPPLAPLGPSPGPSGARRPPSLRSSPRGRLHRAGSFWLWYLPRLSKVRYGTGLRCATPSRARVPALRDKTIITLRRVD